ncbi:hypothetical protein C8J56DRAFT_900654 [Mycena floridula]|nr:hypothetical protein C8J56DRAFT_900654 [Mycena floridula]
MASPSPHYSPCSSAESLGYFDNYLPRPPNLSGSRRQCILLLTTDLTSFNSLSPSWNDPHCIILEHALALLPLERRFAYEDLSTFFDSSDLVVARDLISTSMGWLKIFMHHPALADSPVALQMIARQAFKVCGPAEWASNLFGAPTEQPADAVLPDLVTSPDPAPVSLLLPSDPDDIPKLIDDIGEPVLVDSGSVQESILFDTRDVAMASPPLSPLLFPFPVRAATSGSPQPFGSISALSLGSFMTSLPSRPASVGANPPPFPSTSPITSNPDSCPHCTPYGCTAPSCAHRFPQVARRGRRHRRAPASSRQPIAAFNLSVSSERRPLSAPPFSSPVHTRSSTRDLDQQRGFATALSTHLHNQSAIFLKLLGESWLVRIQVGALVATLLVLMICDGTILVKTDLVEMIVTPVLSLDLRLVAVTVLKCLPSFLTPFVFFLSPFP